MRRFLRVQFGGVPLRLKGAITGSAMLPLGASVSDPCFFFQMVPFRGSVRVPSRPSSGIAWFLQVWGL